MRVVPLAALAAVAGCGILIPHPTTVEEFEQSVKQISDSVRHYQFDVLFPALTAATEAERQRYHQILVDYEKVCGAAPPHFGRREWDRCVAGEARRAAAELGIETFGDYLAGRQAERKELLPRTPRKN
ncbi:MAG: hypothetical protein OXH52_01755 [Gammaproteobacteria bacterium]|nr:hypothetical protein [Gammaproteobacteria bacterium]